MALLYSSTKQVLETHEAVIRALEGDKHAIAITFTPDGTDEEDVIEVCLTEEEVKEAYDLLPFNK